MSGGNQRVARPAEELAHDGVRLRRWRRADAGALYAAVSGSLDHLAPWMAWARDGYDVAAAAEFLARCDLAWQAAEAYHYAILAPAGSPDGPPDGASGGGPDEVVAGSCGLMARAGPGGLEIGYWLRRGYTGRGLATRATVALIAEAFRIGAEWVEIHHDVANLPSARIPKRLGFTAAGDRPAEEPGASSPPRTGVNAVWRRTRARGVPSAGE